MQCMNDECIHHISNENDNDDYDALPSADIVMVASEEKKRGHFVYSTYTKSELDEKFDPPDSEIFPYQPKNAKFQPLKKRGRYNREIKNLWPHWSKILTDQFPKNALAKYLHSILSEEKCNNTVIFTTSMKAVYKLYLDVCRQPIAQNADEIVMLDIGHVRIYDFFKFSGTVR